MPKEVFGRTPREGIQSRSRSRLGGAMNCGSYKRALASLFFKKISIFYKTIASHTKCLVELLQELGTGAITRSM